MLDARIGRERNQNPQMLLTTIPSAANTATKIPEISCRRLLNGGFNFEEY